MLVVSLTECHEFSAKHFVLKLVYTLNRISRESSPEPFPKPYLETPKALQKNGMYE